MMPVMNLFVIRLLVCGDAVGLTEADAAQFLGAKTTDLSTCRWYVTKKITGTRHGLQLVSVWVTHWKMKNFRMVACIISTGFSLINGYISSIICSTGQEYNL